MEELLYLSTTLFILIDPMGNIPLFLSTLKEFEPKKQFFIILREMFFALIVILGFAFLGDFFLSFFRLSQEALMVAGSIILFLIALKMIFPSNQPDAHISPKNKEPFLVPLAIPFTAGPAVLVFVMLYAKKEPQMGILVAAIVIAWVLSTIILLCSSYLKKLLGWRGLVATERLMGLLLTVLAVEMFLRGVMLCIDHG